MDIYTSYFANLRNIPNTIIPISICGKAPSWYSGLQYKKLAPKYWFFMEWKKNHDNNFYLTHFDKEVLQCLDIEKVKLELCVLSKGCDVALMCYEAPQDFCHRHRVAQWLGNVNEFKGSIEK